MLLKHSFVGWKAVSIFPFFLRIEPSQIFLRLRCSTPAWSRACFRRCFALGSAGLLLNGSISAVDGSILVHNENARWLSGRGFRRISGLHAVRDT